MAKRQSEYKKFATACAFHRGDPGRFMGHKYPAPTKSQQQATDIAGAMVGLMMASRIGHRRRV